MISEDVTYLLQSNKAEEDTSSLYLTRTIFSNHYPTEGRSPDRAFRALSSRHTSGLAISLVECGFSRGAAGLAHNKIGM